MKGKTMPQCCGQEVTTPFCPTCGQRHRETPVEVMLLRTLKHRAQHAKPTQEGKWIAWAAWVQYAMEALAPKVEKIAIPETPAGKEGKA